MPREFARGRRRVMRIFRRSATAQLRRTGLWRRRHVFLCAEACRHAGVIPSRPRAVDVGVGSRSSRRSLCLTSPRPGVLRRGPSRSSPANGLHLTQMGSAAAGLVASHHRRVLGADGGSWRMAVTPGDDRARDSGSTPTPSSIYALSILLMLCSAVVVPTLRCSSWPRSTSH